MWKVTFEGENTLATGMRRARYILDTAVPFELWDTPLCNVRGVDEFGDVWEAEKVIVTRVDPHFGKGFTEGVSVGNVCRVGMAGYATLEGRVRRLERMVFGGIS